MQKSIFTVLLTFIGISAAFSQGTISAIDDHDICDKNGSVDVKVTANDFIPDSNFYSLSISNGPKNGFALVLSRDLIQYEPEFNYEGADSLTYMICDSFSCDTAILRINVIADTTQPACIANFNFEVLENQATFSNHSSGGHIFEWHFGDGGQSTEKDPVHNYNGPGEYQVLLIISDSSNCFDSLSKIVSIADTNTKECVAAFEHELNGRTVNFFDKSFGGSGLSHNWDFGNGAGSFEPNPVYTYPNDGEFVVTLTINDSTGCSDTANRIIFVFEDTTSNQCSANFGFESNGEGNVFFFSNHREDSASYSWNFGDSTSGSGPAPNHQYANSGEYNVCLIVTTADCSDTLCKVVFVDIDTSACRAKFETKVQGLTTAFLDHSLNASTWNWNFGDGNTSATQNPVHTYGESGEYMVTLTIFGDSMQCSDTAQHLIFVSNDTTNNNCMSHFSYEMKGDTLFFVDKSQNATSWFWDFNDGTKSTEQNPIKILNTPDSSIFVCLTITGNDSCTSTSCAEVGQREKKETLFGIVYFDANGNGKRDSMENGLDDILVSLTPDDIHRNTQEGGSYFMTFKDTGNHNLKVTLPSNWTITEPATNNGTYDFQTDGSGKHYGPYFFGLTRPDSIKDLSVKVTGFGRTRPGFETYYGINVRNIGSEAMNGTVTFAYDELIEVSSSNPTWATHDTSARVITWDFLDLVPGGHLYFQVNGKVKLNATFEDSLVSIVEVTPITDDVNPANNSHKLVQQVRASYDPNDKQVVPEGKGENNYIGLNPDELLYTIRFQNTGNDTAIFINIEDEIDTDLDFSTLTIVGSSHDVEFSVIEGRLVNFGFDDIFLPDSNVDEPGSHGYVQYSIKPVASLPEETVIENTASIIFDFNEPVITNTTKSTIGEVKTNTSIQTIGFNNSLSLFPNPFNGNLNVKLENAIERGNLIIMDISGRILKSQMLNNITSTQLTLSDLDAGVYLISVSDGNGNTLTQRIIKN
ncbi:MAG: putative repeat protein (TIGR01451 family) [Sphingobacteriales bacterium]|jgi:uncharacterized repeat protein (TIGR01451 family)